MGETSGAMERERSRVPGNRLARKSGSRLNVVCPAAQYICAIGIGTGYLHDRDGLAPLGRAILGHRPQPERIGRRRDQVLDGRPRLEGLGQVGVGAIYLRPIFFVTRCFL